MSYGNKNFNPTAQKPHFSHKTLPHCLGPWATNPSMAEFPQLLRSTWSLKTSWVSGTRWENDVKSSMSMFFSRVTPSFCPEFPCLSCILSHRCHMLYDFIIFYHPLWGESRLRNRGEFLKELPQTSMSLEPWNRTKMPHFFANGFVWTGIHTKNDHGHREIQAINQHKPMNEM